MTDVAANHRKIIGRIHEAALKMGRSAGEIKLLAAAKSQNWMQSGGDRGWGESHRENYVQEAQAKKQKIGNPSNGI